MPNCLDRYPEYIKENEAELNKGGFYVYGWVCEEWGGTYWYIGKGQKGRYKQTEKRGKAFVAIYEHWNVFPVVLRGGMTVEEAEKFEDEIKDDFIFNRGYPIMDGEGSSSALKNRAIRKAKENMPINEDGKRYSVKTGRTMGRPPVDVPMFDHYYAKQQAGDLTVIQCCKLLGISRATWFNLKRRRSA